MTTPRPFRGGVSSPRSPDGKNPHLVSTANGEELIDVDSLDILFDFRFDVPVGKGFGDAAEIRESNRKARNDVEDLIFGEIFASEGAKNFNSEFRHGGSGERLSHEKKIPDRARNAIEKIIFSHFFFSGFFIFFLDKPLLQVSCVYGGRVGRAP
jgi:hypothetical protein